MRCPTLRELPPPPPDKTGWPWTEESQLLTETMPDGDPLPKISIITPSYNQGRFLEETIRSILLQGYPNLEYIIIDGGSTDNSVEIIKKYKPWLSYWVSEPDKGQSHAINKGFEKATGQILGWLNSDDMYLPNCLSVVACQWDKNINFILGNVILINEESNIIGEMRSQISDSGKFDPCAYDCCVPQPATFFSRDIYKECGPLDEFMHYAMDMDFWIHISSKGILFCQSREFLAYFRRHQNTKSSLGTFLFVKELTNKYYRMLKNPCNFSRIYINKKIFAYICSKYLDYFAISDIRNFLQNYIRFIKISPINGFLYGLKRIFKYLKRIFKYLLKTLPYRV